MYPKKHVSKGFENSPNRIEAHTDQSGDITKQEIIGQLTDSVPEVNAQKT